MCICIMKTPETKFRGLGSISGPSPRQNAPGAPADQAAAMKVVPPSAIAIEVMTCEMPRAGGEVERADMGSSPFQSIDGLVDRFILAYE